MPERRFRLELERIGAVSRRLIVRAGLKKKGAESDAPAIGMASIVSDQIRELIVRGALSPGVHLGQAELAERFSVSRVPVREALKLLAAEGAVSHDPNRGFFVTALASDEAQQLYRMRHLVENELMASIEWPTPEVLNQMRARVNEMEILLRNGSFAEWVATHRAFHRSIFDLSPQKILVREVERLWALTDRYRSLLPPPSVEELGEPLMTTALAEKDRRALMRVFNADRARVEEKLLRILRDRRL